jgi:hypothetical protein
VAAVRCDEHHGCVAMVKFLRFRNRDYERIFVQVDALVGLVDDFCTQIPAER